MTRFDLPDRQTSRDTAGAAVDRLTRLRSRPGARSPGDPRASFDEIHGSEHRKVLGTLLRKGIRRAVAEELAQEIFTTLHLQMIKGEVEKPAAMLVTITAHEINNHRQKRGNSPGLEEAVDEDELPSGQPDPELQLILAENAQIVWDALAEMPSKAANLMHLIDLQRETQEAVAESMGIPLGTLKSRHRAAREMVTDAVLAAFGLPERKTSPRAKPFLSARMGPTQNEIILRAKAVARRGVSYGWQLSLDGGQAWVTIGTTTEAHTSLLGSTPLTTYLFRFQSTIKQTTSAWSQTIRFTTP